MVSGSLLGRLIRLSNVTLLRLGEAVDEVLRLPDVDFTVLSEIAHIRVDTPIPGIRLHLANVRVNDANDVCHESLERVASACGATESSLKKPEVDVTSAHDSNLT